MFTKKKEKSRQELPEVQLSQPAFTDEPADPQGAVDPSTADQQEPAQRDQPDQPDQTQPSEPSEPSKPSDSAEPSEPSELADPIEQAYCLGAGIDADTLARAKAIMADFSASANGRFRPELLQLAIRMLNYDEDIARAREEGAARARAEKSAEAFRARRSAAAEAASLPHLRGCKELSTPLSDSIFSIAREAR